MTQTWFGVASTSDVASTQELTQPWLEGFIPTARTEKAASTPVHTGAPAQLVVSRGPDAGTGFALTEPRITIGRHRECDIVFDDVTVSRTHAEIHRTGDGYVLVDAGSLNGTYLNRRPVEVAMLADGDEVWVGKVRFTFRSNGDGDADPAASATRPWAA